MIGSYLWSWQRAHPTVSPSQTVAVVSARSATYSTRNSSWTMPPSALVAMIAVETRRDLLVERRVRQQVARDLLDRELIERHVAVERVDHPVAPRPHRPRASVW